MGKTVNGATISEHLPSWQPCRGWILSSSGLWEFSLLLQVAENG